MEKGTACGSVTEGRSDNRRTVKPAWPAWGRPGFSGRWQALKGLLFVIAGLVIGSRPAKAQSVANGNFEAGSFTSAGAFAGGTTNASFAPTSWSASLNTSFGDAKWVQSTAARSGTKYGYATSTADVNSNNDACLQYNVSGLTVGNCYTLTVYAAEAGGPVNNPAGNPGLMTLEFANGTAPSGGFEYGRFFLPNNTQWSDTALTGRAIFFL